MKAVLFSFDQKDLILAEQKALKIVRSCETIGQLMTASAYIRQLIKRFSSEYPVTVFQVAGRLNWIWNDKLQKLKDHE